MEILLDTHSWLWALSEPNRLSKRAREIVVGRSHSVFLSAVSCWEISIRWANGKLKLDDPPATFIPERLTSDGITVLPVTLKHALQVSTLPHHRWWLTQALIDFPDHGGNWVTMKTRGAVTAVRRFGERGVSWIFIQNATGFQSPALTFSINTPASLLLSLEDGGPILYNAGANELVLHLKAPYNRTVRAGPGAWIRSTTIGDTVLEGMPMRE